MWVIFIKDKRTRLHEMVKDVLRNTSCFDNISKIFEKFKEKTSSLKFYLIINSITDIFHSTYISNFIQSPSYMKLLLFSSVLDCFFFWLVDVLINISKFYRNAHQNHPLLVYLKIWWLAQYDLLFSLSSHQLSKFLLWFVLI